MRRSHLVPLSTQALDLLNELKIMTGNSRYVFPGRNDPSKPMREASINQVIKRIGFGEKLRDMVLDICYQRFYMKKVLIHHI